MRTAEARTSDTTLLASAQAGDRGAFDRLEEEGRDAAFWVPYVEVADVAAASEEAARLGAAVLLPAREGPAGWRAIVSPPDGGQLAFWRPKG